MRIWYYKMGCMHFLQLGRTRIHFAAVMMGVEHGQLMPTPPTWHNHPFFTAN